MLCLRGSEPIPFGESFQNSRKSSTGSARNLNEMVNHHIPMDCSDALPTLRAARNMTAGGTKTNQTNRKFTYQRPFSTTQAISLTTKMPTTILAPIDSHFQAINREKAAAAQRPSRNKSSSGTGPVTEGSGTMIRRQTKVRTRIVQTRAIHRITVADREWISATITSHFPYSTAWLKNPRLERTRRLGINNFYQDHICK